MKIEAHQSNSIVYVVDLKTLDFPVDHDYDIHVWDVYLVCHEYVSLLQLEKLFEPLMNIEII